MSPTTCCILALSSAAAWSLVTALLLLAVTVCFVALLRTGRGIQRLLPGLARFAGGQFAPPLDRAGPPPLPALIDALNDMGQALDQRLQTALRERNQLEAVLGSMVEGVIAVDKEQRITTLNAAAAELLEVDAGRAVGRSIQEAVRNPALQQFVGRMLASESPAQGDLELRLTVVDAGQREAGVAERFVRVQGAALRDAVGRWIGALVVLEDVTRLRKLEVVRRDFVANVSHEIKTPVTAIKVAAETLLDSAASDPQSTERFLGIIHRQSDRLHSLVEDILSLARIEQDTDKQRVALKYGKVAEVLTAALDACRLHAEAKAMPLQLTCDPALRTRLNAALLEQAVVNLLDNAIKYSPAGSPIRVTAEATGGEVVIAVIDQGPGIEAEHLPRIFERFYRTDKARSRNLGGTGLGLAIVKHAAVAQGGRVSVQSTIGAGSTFRVHLPAVEGEG
jgi:two-component system, OmpR family, phosphate regulon sensor histidine kinase PhoR